MFAGFECKKTNCIVGLFFCSLPRFDVVVVVVVVAVIVVIVVAVSFLAEICFNYEKLKVVHCNGWWLVSESDPLRRQR